MIDIGFERLSDEVVLIDGKYYCEMSDEETAVSVWLQPNRCPACGGEVIYYHSSVTSGDGITRVVCKKKCQGWKVLQEIDRKKSNKTDPANQVTLAADTYIMHRRFYEKERHT